MTDSVYPVAICDISVYQGKVDFNILRQSAQAVYIRAGYGNVGLDANTATNVAGAKAAGMPYGLYWFARAGMDYKKHIASFRARYNEFGGHLPPVWDCEYTDLNKQDTSKWLNRLIKEWGNQTGVLPMIYTAAWWWDFYTVRMDWPKEYDLWVAHYTSAALPRIPEDWKTRGWTLWQWSADGNRSGPGHGVQSADVDRNRFYGSVEQFNQKYKTNILPLGEQPAVPPVLPEPQPMPVTLPPFVTIKMPVANVRSFPEMADNNIIGKTYRNNAWRVIGEEGEWWKVEGYIGKEVTVEHPHA